MTESSASSSDMSHWERLYRDHKDYMLTAAACLVGHRRDIAEDILHDVFVTLCRKVDLRSIKNPRAFLVAACLNRARDWLRQTKLRSAQPFGVELHEIQITPRDQLELDEIRREVIKSVARLPVDQREVLVLRVYGQLTFLEISEQLGTSLHTTKSRYRYAVKRLQKQLKQYPGDLICD